MRHSSTQRGSALWVILIAAALFAALSYAMMRGGSTGQQNLTNEQARLAAQEIIAYGNTIADTVQKLKLRGCADAQISFEGYWIYTNALSPIDESCRVFSPAGGKMPIPSKITVGLSTSLSGSSNYGYIVFTGNTNVVGMGTTSMDLSMYIPYVDKKVCEKVNTLLGVQSLLTTDGVSGVGLFDGTYASGGSPNIGDNDTSLAGKSAFCYTANGTAYSFHQVIILR